MWMEPAKEPKASTPFLACRQVKRLRLPAFTKGERDARESRGRKGDSSWMEDSSARPLATGEAEELILLLCSIGDQWRPPPAFFGLSLDSLLLESLARRGKPCFPSLACSCLTSLLLLYRYCTVLSTVCSFSRLLLSSPSRLLQQNEKGAPVQFPVPKQRVRSSHTRSRLALVSLSFPFSCPTFRIR